MIQFFVYNTTKVHSVGVYRVTHWGQCEPAQLADQAWVAGDVVLENTTGHVLIDYAQVGDTIRYNGYAPDTGLFSVCVFSTEEDGSLITPDVNLMTLDTVQTATAKKTFAAEIDATGSLLKLGNRTASGTVAIGAGATINGETKTIEVGAEGLTASTTNVTFGSAASGILGMFRMRLPQSLFGGTGVGHALRVNKSATAQTSSVEFDDNLVAKSEIGLIGSNDLTLRVSPSAGTWIEGLKVILATGRTKILKALNLAPSAGEPASVANGDMWYDSDLGKFRVRQNGVSMNMVVPPNPDFVANTLKGENGDAVSLTSTGHAIQAGLTTGLNLAIGPARVQARNAGAASQLLVNSYGGDVHLGDGTTSVLKLDGVLNTSSQAIATLAEAQAASANNKIMTPIHVKAYVDSILPTQAEAQAGTNNTKLMTPLRVAEQLQTMAIGWGQTWQNVTASRLANTAYQNTTGRPIMVRAHLPEDQQLQVSADGTTWLTLWTADADQDAGAVGGGFIIPAGHFYRATGVHGATSAWWLELR